MAGVPYTSDYRYDGMGNRTLNSRVIAAASSTTTSTANALNQLKTATTVATNSPTVTSNLYYDTAGNLTTTVNSDGSGRTTYGYDDADRLTRIERRGNAGQLVTVSEFGYDYASRRSFTREYDFANGGWANPVITRRVFDGLDVVQERNNANQVTAQLVRDGGVGGILSRTTATGPAFYGYDGNGNVSLLTDSAGGDVGHYRYDAFGNTLEVWGTRGSENPYRFSTKELHGPSGLYDYGFRFYSPGMGRWMNRDPLAEGGGVNLYGMVGNDPINDIDAYGLAPKKKKDTRPCANDGIEDSCKTGKKSVVERAVDWFNKNVLDTPTVKPIDGEDPAETTIRQKRAITTSRITPTRKALPAFTTTTINTMLAYSRSAQPPNFKTTKGASKLQKRVADGLMSGVKPTQANADKILLDVLSRPLRVQATQKFGQIDVIGRSFGREVGVRINPQIGEFVGFRTPDF